METVMLVNKRVVTKSELVEALESIRQNLYDDETRHLGIYSSNHNGSEGQLRQIMRARHDRDILSIAIQFINQSLFQNVEVKD